MSARAVFSMNCVTDLNLLLCSGQFSFELEVFLPERIHRQVELLAPVLELCDEFTRFFVGDLEQTESVPVNGDER